MNNALFNPYGTNTSIEGSYVSANEAFDKRIADAFKSLNVVKDSYKFFPHISSDKMQDYTEYDGKLVPKSDLNEILNETYQQYLNEATEKNYKKVLNQEEYEEQRKFLLNNLYDRRQYDREEYIGQSLLDNYISYKEDDFHNEQFKQFFLNKYGSVFKAMDKVVPKLDKLTDTEIKDFTGLINTLSNPYRQAMSKNKDFDSTDALSILRGQDISGLKKYREKMDLSKSDILDLIQPPPNSNMAIRGLTSLVKNALKFKTFKSGGLINK